MAMQATAFFLTTGVIGIGYNRWECFLDCNILLSINLYCFSYFTSLHFTLLRKSLLQTFETTEKRLDLFTSQQNHGRLPITIPAQERPGGF
jgi:hypothetical protein